MQNNWKIVYTTHENRIYEVWNEERRREYIEELRERENECKNTRATDTDGNEVGIIAQQLREHYDMAFKCEQKTPRPMIEEEAQISTNDIKTQLKKIKLRKAPGPDGIKAELFKVLVDSNKCTKELTLPKYYCRQLEEIQHYSHTKDEKADSQRFKNNCFCQCIL